MRTLVVDGVTRKPVKWVGSRWEGLRWGSAYTARTGHDVFVVAPRTARGQRVVDKVAIGLRDKPGVVVNNPLPPHPGWIAAAAVAVIGIWYVVAASSKPVQVQPSGISGLTAGSTYRVVARIVDTTIADPTLIASSLSTQGFTVSTINPNSNGDPFVFDAVGVYSGNTGELHDTLGVSYLDAYSTSGQHVGVQYVTERPVQLQSGVTYFGRGDVGWPLSMAVTKSAVANKLNSLGFTNIAVYIDPSELPASWPNSEREGNVFAQATYSASSPVTFTPPSQIVSIWKAG